MSTAPDGDRSLGLTLFKERDLAVDNNNTCTLLYLADEMRDRQDKRCIVGNGMEAHA